MVAFHWCLAPLSAKETPSGPIWRSGLSVEPLAPVALVEGKVRRVSLIDTTIPAPVRIAQPPEVPWLEVEVLEDGLTLLLTQRSGSAGSGLLPVVLELADGTTRSLVIPYTATAQPAIGLQYRPAAGTEPKRVYVAGDFNGWNGGKDEMIKGPDGTFRISLALAAGEYGYKFVVDGEWIKDADNPLEAPGDYGNSLLRIAAKPKVEFTYTPTAGTSPTKVSLAGSFNDWSQTRDPLTKGDDGVWRASLSLDPGKHTYKFVVDGAWVADPSNPKTDDGGYGNSLLILGSGEEPVKAASVGVVGVTYLAAAMPGAGPNGGLLPQLPEGDALLTDKLTLILNNEQLELSAFTLNTTTGVVALNLPKQRLYAENYLTVMGTSAEGNEVYAQLALAQPDAARSPRDEVIYYAFTDRFADGDPSINKPAVHEDLHPLANYMGGDWAGIRKKIEEGYFTKLGVSTIWIAPVMSNTQEVHKDSVPPHRWFTSYHGYWPDSLTETNAQFGSMDDLKALVKTAHEHGIAVLMDYVANHMYIDHPVLKEHPEYIVDAYTPSGELNIRKFDEFPLTTWFDTFIPTLDYDANPELVELMAQNSIWWLKETGADGFRHDAVKHIPSVFWRTVTSNIRKVFHHGEGRFVYQVGETISGHDTINEFIGPDLLTGQFDFPLYFTIESVLARGTNNMADLGKTALKSQSTYPAGAIMSPLLGNHDVIRFMGWVDRDIPAGMDQKEIGFKQPPVVDNPESYERMRMAFAFLFAVPGPPTIYYGDEIGLTGAHDPDNRRLMPWDWDAEQQKTHDTVASLAAARHESAALRRGRLEVIHSDAERLVLARVAVDDVVLVALSRRPTDTTYRLAWPKHWGTPKSLEELAPGHNMDLTVVPEGLIIQDGPEGFGVFRVIW